MSNFYLCKATISQSWTAENGAIVMNEAPDIVVQADDPAEALAISENKWGSMPLPSRLDATVTFLVTSEYVLIKG